MHTFESTVILPGIYPKVPIRQIRKDACARIFITLLTTLKTGGKKDVYMRLEVLLSEKSFLKNMFIEQNEQNHSSYLYKLCVSSHRNDI